MTEFQVRTLRILSDNPGIRANELAEALWPESGMHNRTSNCGAGSGSRQGVGAWRAVGGQMGKLEKLGWVVSGYGGRPFFCYTPNGYVMVCPDINIRYGLSSKGLEALNELAGPI